MQGGRSTNLLQVVFFKYSKKLNLLLITYGQIHEV